MLCLLAGWCDLAGSTEKSIRNQRTRSTRASRPDVDHELHDHSLDTAVGNVASSLHHQCIPDDRDTSFAAEIAPSALPLPAFDETVILPDLPASLPVRLPLGPHAGRAPPSILFS